MTKPIALTLCIGLALACGNAAAANDQGANGRDVARISNIPKILDQTDRQKYRSIFSLQKSGKWRRADRTIKTLENRLLMGHVLAQRYLHPTHYRSRFGELSRWMKDYADHPDARRIYGLALRRKPAKARAPRPPQRISPRVFNNGKKYKPKARPRAFGRGLSRTERRLQYRIARFVRREYLTHAEKYLKRKDTVRLVGRAGVDRARAIIASGWFRRGDTKKALRLAGDAARRSGRAAPWAQWWAGIAAFRLGQYDEAAAYFQTMAQSPGLAGGDVAAAAFWAARAHLVGGNPRDVSPWMAEAAAHPRSFYGFLASYILGTPPRFNWQPPRMDQQELETLVGSGTGKRALALIEVGEGRRAERELRLIRHFSSPRLLRTVIALAGNANLPGTELRAARTLNALSGERIDNALYPVPRWQPRDGYQIDRALIYALARQESGFNARAKSRRGARGLLQLMPATARLMAQSRRSFRGRGRNKLYDPQLNLALGQRYVDHLLTGDVTSGNLILMIASYNGGPGNTSKWQRKLNHGADPLIFMETIPLRETRLFVKRVLENLWTYRIRLGQPVPSLASLAGGQWPFYVGLDETTSP